MDVIVGADTSKSWHWKGSWRVPDGEKPWMIVVATDDGQKEYVPTVITICPIPDETNPHPKGLRWSGRGYHLILRSATDGRYGNPAAAICQPRMSEFHCHADGLRALSCYYLLAVNMSGVRDVNVKTSGGIILYHCRSPMFDIIFNS